jgi:hypothetical protein
MPFLDAHHRALGAAQHRPDEDGSAKFPDGDVIGDDPTTATVEPPLGYDGAGRLQTVPGYVSSMSYV